MEELPIHITADGRVLRHSGLTWEEVSTDELARLLDLAADRGAAVVYGRDDPTAEPHPAFASVLDLIIARKLPVRLDPERGHVEVGDA